MNIGGWLWFRGGLGSFLFGKYEGVRCVNFIFRVFILGIELIVFFLGFEGFIFICIMVIFLMLWWIL